MGYPTSESYHFYRKKAYPTPETSYFRGKMPCPTSHNIFVCRKKACLTSQNLSVFRNLAFQTKQIPCIHGKNDCLTPIKPNTAGYWLLPAKKSSFTTVNIEDPPE